MPIPSVDVVTGIVTNGPIEVDEAFRWTCSEFSANITVTALPAAWFTPNPASFAAPDGSATVTAVLISPGGEEWTWTASGVEVAPGARVAVGDSLTKHAKKAS